MEKHKKKYSSELLKDNIITAMLEKNAQDVVIMDLRELFNSIADFFIICHGNSDVQMYAIADGIRRYCRETLGEKPFSMEGKENAEWILLDYFDVVVHIFNESARNYYDLETLWGDAKRIDIDESGKPIKLKN
jgi:ribosome-associated protein